MEEAKRDNISGKTLAIKSAPAPERNELSEFVIENGITIRLRGDMHIKLSDSEKSCRTGCNIFFLEQDPLHPRPPNVVPAATRIGHVSMCSCRLRDYDGSPKEDLFGLGLSDEDIVSEITSFFPTELDSLKNKGIGGGVLERVVAVCGESGASAVCASTEQPEMQDMLLNPKFGFYESPKGDFIRVLRKLQPVDNPEADGLQRAVRPGNTLE
jgi:hypothetical protein